MIHFTLCRPPSKNQVGGELLDHNYNNCMVENKSSLGKSAKVFGIGFMSDGATIGRTPFSNMFALTGDVPPCPVAIIDATEHMATGGVKDAAYIAKYMEEHMVKYDPDKTVTDILFFDGASSVQKGGSVLEAIFPRVTTIHGGEHVISLFFDDVAKLAPIKVCTHSVFLNSSNTSCFIVPYPSIIYLRH